MKRWIILIVSILAVIALCALIWFVLFAVFCGGLATETIHQFGLHLWY